MLPPLYKCEICDLSVDPRGSTTLRLITGWAKGNNTNVKYLESHQYRYKHEACHGSEPQEETLF